MTAVKLLEEEIDYHLNYDVHISIISKKDGFTDKCYEKQLEDITHLMEEELYRMHS